MKEKNESQHDIVGLDMPNGLHQDEPWMSYKQKFVKAPSSLHPKKEMSHGRKFSPLECMDMIYRRK